MSNFIPKILHQIWIGPLSPPLSLMETWKEKHPDYEYIFWNEEEISKHGIVFSCQEKIDKMNEWNGKADIMRWEILYKFGGYFVDADSICIEPFDDYFSGKSAFASFENSDLRNELIATGTMGFVPNHPLCRDIIEWINSQEFDNMNQLVRAWGTVGPGLLTYFLSKGKYTDFSVYPSYCFLPIHFSGDTYYGHKKVYAHQLWGTAKNISSNMNFLDLPLILREPTLWVSVLIPSYNTPEQYIKDCLESIKNQSGHFGIEIVWINDGSRDEYTQVLEYLLEDFKKRTRYCRVVYKRLEDNRGVCYSQRIGIEMCSHEIIFRMDSDDIMLPHRMKTQIDFMNQHKDCVICGANIQLFTSDALGNKKYYRVTNHPEKLTWSEFLRTQPHWFMNQPTLCFLKSAVLSVGNYNDRRNIPIGEDYELEVKLLKKYGAVYNITELLVCYRLHENQLTYKHASDTLEMDHFRRNLLREISE